MSRFYNKTLCIIGGSGYIGQAVAREALKKGINVIAVSRSGAYNCPILKDYELSGKYRPVKGDALHPLSFAEHLKNADALVHTVGTLIDTSVTKRAPGSYEQMNRDALISVAKQLEKNEKNAQKNTNKHKKIVYFSASMAPPFLPKYKTTKDEAAAYIISSENLDATVLEPGFIWSWEQRKWSFFLSYLVDIWAKIFTPFYNKFVPENTYMKKFLANFLVDRSIQLEDVTRAAVYSAFNSAQNGQYLRNQEMEKLSVYYNLDIALNEEEAGQNQSGKYQMESDLKLQKEQQEKQQQEKLNQQKLQDQMQEQEDESANWIKQDSKTANWTENEIEKNQKLNEQKLQDQMQEQDDESANWIKKQSKETDWTQDDIVKQQKQKEQKLQDSMQEMEDESANWIKKEVNSNNWTEKTIEKNQKLNEQKLQESQQEMDDESANWNKKK
ncbi:hypothetical protein PPERSA_07063 [Pseudocohnilembus persalinus]|uniref:NAD(P)-binding domain-containing protein n=1 Tax=Pseudocohnilembus persalinus TaxID=266149 RepID=A0A0V0QAV3_PSEPJ|nr:hypothetical protein PPERSA_07063 [Pseudocohnilembus persalinus]|eukprot:KRW99291.1 hypothetical protein PPERSA_07063 [Pseudocohnilembus persalinus]